MGAGQNDPSFFRIDGDASLAELAQAVRSFCPRTPLRSRSGFVSTGSRSGSTNYEAPSNPQRVVETGPPSPIEPNTEMPKDYSPALSSQPMTLRPKRVNRPYRVRKDTKLKFLPGRYSCPYRKRNPRMFNVCEFRKCAVDSFRTIAEVKFV